MPCLFNFDKLVKTKKHWWRSEEKLGVRYSNLGRIPVGWSVLHGILNLHLKAVMQERRKAEEAELVRLKKVQYDAIKNDTGYGTSRSLNGEVEFLCTVSRISSGELSNSLDIALGWRILSL